MASVNKVILIGNLGRDPVVNQTQSGMTIATLAVATTYKSKDREETEWHQVVFFDKMAEICQKYLRKGSSVFVEGRLKTDKFEKNGQTHYATKVIGASMQMLGGKPKDSNSNDGFETVAKQRPAQPSSSIDNLYEDCPF